MKSLIESITHRCAAKSQWCLCSLCQKPVPGSGRKQAEPKWISPLNVTYSSTAMTTDLQAQRVESVDDPHTVGPVTLQCRATHHHVPETGRVCRTDIRVSRERRHGQCVSAAGCRRKRLHAAETSVYVILRGQGHVHTSCYVEFIITERLSPGTKY